MFPLIFAAAAIGSGIVKGISSIYASQAEADAARKQAEYNKKQNDAAARAADQNARFADMDAVDAVKRGDKAAGQLRVGTRRMIGSQRSSFAAQGISTTDGSAGDIVAETQTLSELDEITLKNNAWRESFGFKVQAHNYRDQAQLHREAGEFAYQAGEATARSASTVGILNASSSMLGSGYAFAKSQGWTTSEEGDE